MTRSWLNFIGGMLVLMVLAYGLLPSIVGTSGLQKFCANIQPSESVENLIERADIAGYITLTADLTGDDYILVMKNNEMSRFVCEVKIHDKNAVSARYILKQPPREANSNPSN